MKRRNSVKIKALLFVAVFLPIVYLCAVLASPYYALAVWGGMRKEMDHVNEIVGERIKEAMIRFAG